MNIKMTPVADGFDYEYEHDNGELTQGWTRGTRREAIAEAREHIAYDSEEIDRYRRQWASELYGPTDY